MMQKSMSFQGRGSVGGPRRGDMVHKLVTCCLVEGLVTCCLVKGLVTCCLSLASLPNPNPTHRASKYCFGRIRQWIIHRPYHQQPEVNCIQVLEEFDFPCTVHAQRVPFKGNQLRAETG